MLMTFLEMGNKLICCRWQWIESPEVKNHLFNDISEHSNGIHNYPNGYIANAEGLDNEYIKNNTRYSRALVNKKETVNNGAKKTVYFVPDNLNQYEPTKICAEVNFSYPAPFFNKKTGLCYQNNNSVYQQMEASCRDSWMIRSTEQLQHISEREPEDIENDPSVNARNPTLFLKRSKEERGHNVKDDRKVDHDLGNSGECRVRQWSSCSTVWLDDSTISHPSPALSLKTLALAVHLHMRVDECHEDRHVCSPDDSLYSIFDERRHPVVRPGSQSDPMRPPSHREIYRFLRGIFNMAQLTPECAIVTLVYLERLLTSAEMEMMPWSWRRQLLASVLVASKVWDDQAVWNVDYCQILKELCVEDLNDLERHFLELIQFNINVPSSVYAHYYFDLLHLGRREGLYNQSPNHRPLSWARALRLEALSCRPGPLEDDHWPIWSSESGPLPKSHSWDSVPGARLPVPYRPVIIS